MTDFLVRGTHRAAFRSGEWGRVEGLVWLKDRPCYKVRFIDGKTDSWPIYDPSDPYEFKAIEPEAPDGFWVGSGLIDSSDLEAATPMLNAARDRGETTAVVAGHLWVYHEAPRA